METWAIESNTSYFPFSVFWQQELVNNLTTWTTELTFQYDPTRSAEFPGKALLASATFNMLSASMPGCKASATGSTAVTISSTNGSTASGTFKIACPVPAAGTWGKFDASKGSWTAVTPGGPLGAYITPSLSQWVRCDRYRGNIGAACVLGNIGGEIDWDVSSDIGEAVAGYLWWQTRLTGHPGYLNDTYGYGSALIYSPSSSDANSAAACAQASTPPGPWTAAKRVDPNDTCDEYPFATTSNGASGKVYGTQWGRCSVDGGQNSTAGSRMGASLRLDHIVPGDEYRVRISGSLPDMSVRCSR